MKNFFLLYFFLASLKGHAYHTGPEIDYINSSENFNVLTNTADDFFKKNFNVGADNLDPKLSLVLEKLAVYGFDIKDLTDLLGTIKFIKETNFTEKLARFLSAANKVSQLYDVTLKPRKKNYIFAVKLLCKIKTQNIIIFIDLLNNLNFLSKDWRFTSLNANSYEEFLENRKFIHFINCNSKFINHLPIINVDFLAFLDIINSIISHNQETIKNIIKYAEIIYSESHAFSDNIANQKKATEDFLNAIAFNGANCADAHLLLKNFLNFYYNTSLELRYFIGAYLLKNISSGSVSEVMEIMLDNAPISQLAPFDFINNLTKIAKEISNNKIDYIAEIQKLYPEIKAWGEKSKNSIKFSFITNPGKFERFIDFLRERLKTHYWMSKRGTLPHPEELENLRNNRLLYLANNNNLEISKIAFVDQETANNNNASKFDECEEEILEEAREKRLARFVNHSIILDGEAKNQVKADREVDECSKVFREEIREKRLAKFNGLPSSFNKDNIEPFFNKSYFQQKKKTYTNILKSNIGSSTNKYRRMRRSKRSDKMLLSKDQMSIINPSQEYPMEYSFGINTFGDKMEEYESLSSFEVIPTFDDLGKKRNNSNE